MKNYGRFKIRYTFRSSLPQPLFGASQSVLPSLPSPHSPLPPFCLLASLASASFCRLPRSHRSRRQPRFAPVIIIASLHGPASHCSHHHHRRHFAFIPPLRQQAIAASPLSLSLSHSPFLSFSLAHILTSLSCISEHSFVSLPPKPPRRLESRLSRRQAYSNVVVAVSLYCRHIIKIIAPSLLYR